MKTKLLLYTAASSVVMLMSFTQTDFQKMLIGKWELKTIESPGKPPVNSKPILGVVFFEFKKDFTYIESGGNSDFKKGTWKITEGMYLHLKRDTQTDYINKEKLREISANKIEMTHPDKKKFVFTRVK